MECKFTVGQKVVRIGGAQGSEKLPAHYPEYGKIYTVRAINDHGGDRVLIRLCEIDNSHMVPDFGDIEPGFHYSYFRPIITRKTDIGIFKAMLTDQKQAVPA